MIKNSTLDRAHSATLKKLIQSSELIARMYCVLENATDIRSAVWAYAELGELVRKIINISETSLEELQAQLILIINISQQQKSKRAIVKKYHRAIELVIDESVVSFESALENIHFGLLATQEFLLLDEIETPDNTQVSQVKKIIFEEITPLVTPERIKINEAIYRLQNEFEGNVRVQGLLSKLQMMTNDFFAHPESGDENWFKNFIGVCENVKKNEIKKEIVDDLIVEVNQLQEKQIAQGCCERHPVDKPRGFVEFCRKFLKWEFV